MIRPRLCATSSAALLFGLASSAATPALGAPGDVDTPLIIGRAPFVHSFTTVGQRGMIDRYACADQLDEHGPEVVYEVEIAAAGRLTAWVDGDGGGIDIDVHILSSLSLDEGDATGCLDRGNLGATADVEAGRYFVVVDSYDGPEQAGPYRLRVDVGPEDDWYERPLARGITLATKRYPDLFGSREFGAVLRIDTSDPEVVIRPISSGGCSTVSALGEAEGAVAAVNGGFFGPGCASVSLLKIDGGLIATNSTSRTAFGVTEDGATALAFVPAGRDWPEAVQAMGGVPRIVSDGEQDVRAAEEGASGSFSTARHPRTVIGLAHNELIMATVDGRTSAGAGMSLSELAQWMIWLGADEALNLDGGGSTTLWARGEPFGGVVNHPSDNGQADHAGQRAVSNAVGVWGAALDRDPVWMTEPDLPPPLEEGDTWTYEAMAADPEGLAIEYTVTAPEGFAGEAVVDLVDGVAQLRFSPSARDARLSPVGIELHAQAGQDQATQHIELRVDGPIPELDGGVGPEPSDDAAVLHDSGAAGDASELDALEARSDSARAVTDGAVDAEPDPMIDIDTDAGKNDAADGDGGDGGGCQQGPVASGLIWVLALCFRRRRRG